MIKKVEFKGACTGIELAPRGDDDPHICAVILIEDDENWFPQLTISSFWIDELIAQLTLARDFLATQEPYVKDGIQYGWAFKEEKEGEKNETGKENSGV